MYNPKILYFEEEDILHLVLSEDAEANSYEIAPNVTVELNSQGEMIGVEILNASQFMRDFLLESFQAKLLQTV